MIFDDLTATRATAKGAAYSLLYMHGNSLICMTHMSHILCTDSLMNPLYVKLCMNSILERLYL